MKKSFWRKRTSSDKQASSEKAKPKQPDAAKPAKAKLRFGKRNATELWKTQKHSA